ncbi:MAG TPA: class I SAM-dependent methyltransferase [Planctomycetota bacterium]|nr:class I SAM-dependent methyltransferase [Planctomycetota bacterium]
MAQINPHADAAYDLIGCYQQDEVNGFSKELIFQMLLAADPRRATSVLDAMAGDGNLTRRLAEYCRGIGIPLPATTALEYSRIQASVAQRDLAPLNARVVWGDVLGMNDLSTGEELPDCSFDRVLIKSANHEIPFGSQAQLYRSVFRVLQPGGLFVNLGMLFDDAKERDELREIARVKDTFAGKHAAAFNRFLLTRPELYAFLQGAGFIEVRAAHALDDVIHSHPVGEQYFRPEIREKTDLEFQAAQIKAPTLRRNGRLRFEGTSSVLRCPGEVTIARRPTLAHSNASIFREYPMDFLRHVRAHAQMLEEAARWVPNKSSLLDPGCGIGLLTEHLSQPGLKYTGLDFSQDFIRICSDRYGKRAGFSFHVADINSLEFGTEAYDVVTLLNTLNLPGMNALGVLRRAFDAVRKGGRVIVSGPTDRESFSRAEPSILAQLEHDGRRTGNEAQVQALRAAHAGLLTGRGNYWSVEGMIALLKHLGFTSIVAANHELYYGCAYMVVAAKPG